MAIELEEKPRYIEAVMTIESDTAARYEATIADLKAQRALIDKAITTLEGMLALTVRSAPATRTEPLVEQSNAVPETAGATVFNDIADGPYYGLGLAEAAIKCLSFRVNHPRTVKNIWKMLSDAGVRILSDKPESALGWALRKRERRVGDVLLIGNGEWGLREWFSPAAIDEIMAKRNNASGRNREEHSERTKLGMELAFKHRGVRIGAKRKMTPEMKELGLRLFMEPGATTKSVAAALGVATSSLNGNKINHQTAKAHFLATSRTARETQEEKGATVVTLHGRTR
jgi:hypothetical protein